MSTHIAGGQPSKMDILDAICKMLSPIAKKGVLDHENEFGVVVMKNNNDEAEMRFMLVTKDMILMDIYFA